jgi:hypothetical protein
METWHYSEEERDPQLRRDPARTGLYAGAVVVGELFALPFTEGHDPFRIDHYKAVNTPEIENPVRQPVGLGRLPIDRLFTVTPVRDVIAHQQAALAELNTEDYTFAA